MFKEWKFRPDDVDDDENLIYMLYLCMCKYMNQTNKQLNRKIQAKLSEQECKEDR